ncbi:MAG TPA: DNA polymerase III subunit epsilon [Beijerinckiaceae bacterium]|nr:DNA polymerase III subunit epsilon [Beijerinckiaceae bacterium]
MREIILDTETTGLDPRSGHRIVEIGCVECIDQFLTGRTFHHYVNPERSMPPDAFAVHGLSDGFLKDKPVFADIADAFVEFLGEARLVIHNAGFDLGFLNHELARCGRPLIGSDRIVDTLLLARRKHPGQSNSLDALCQRYGIDNSRRTKHGALMDAEILAEVYAELSGGRQRSLGLAIAETVETNVVAIVPGQAYQPPPPLLGEAERAAHRALVESLGGKALWRDYLGLDANQDRPPKA